MLKRKNTIYFMAIAVIVICAGILALSEKGNTGNLIYEESLNDESTDYETEQNLSQDNHTDNSITDTGVEATIQSNIYVYVCGSVNTPGVYELSEGTRIYEAIEVAGGLTDTASPESINLADVLNDGDKIYIPDINDETLPADVNVSASENTASNGLININTASKSELMSIPGIGEAKASAIISYRESTGNFATIEDVMNVSGIKDAAFEKMKDYITVN